MSHLVHDHDRQGALEMQLADGDPRVHRLGEYKGELQVAQQGRQQFPDALELRARQVGALAALGRVGEIEAAQRLAERAVGPPTGERRSMHSSA
jgi:hypothetical protein